MAPSHPRRTLTLSSLTVRTLAGPGLGVGVCEGTHLTDSCDDEGHANPSRACEPQPAPQPKPQDLA